MNRPMTKQEWYDYLEKTWDAAQKEAWAEQAQPVAWRYNLKHRGSFEGVSTEYSPVKLSIGESWTPLYTTPPQRQPLRFPTMLRKMWSGGEVQQWLDENYNNGIKENA